MFKKIKELLSNDSNMKPDEFEKLCKSYLPNCVIKYEGTCGLCCYNGGTDILDIKVSLLEDGRFGVYDQWRNVTFTKDLNFVKKFLQNEMEDEK